MIKVSPNVKFSYNYIKGSVADRKKVVSSLNEKIFEELQSMNTSNITIRDFKSVYNKESILEVVKEKTKEFLKGKSNSDKILHLQDARYELEQEQHAYSEQLKYAKKLKDNGEEVSGQDLIDYEPIYMFSEKIQLLKEMIFNLISEERKKLAKKIK